MMGTVFWVWVIGIGALAIGLFLTIFTSKRKFERTNSSGVEEFDSYWKSLLFPLVDGTGNLVGGLFLVVGTVIVLGMICR